MTLSTCNRLTPKVKNLWECLHNFGCILPKLRITPCHLCIAQDITCILFLGDRKGQLYVNIFQHASFTAGQTQYAINRSSKATMEEVCMDCFLFMTERKAPEQTEYTVNELNLPCKLNMQLFCVLVLHVLGFVMYI